MDDGAWLIVFFMLGVLSFLNAFMPNERIGKENRIALAFMGLTIIISITVLYII